MLYSSLFLFLLYLFHGFMLLWLYLFSIFTPLFPWSLTPSLTHRTCLPYYLFLSPYIRILPFPWFYVIMYSFRNFCSLSPANFRSLPRTLHLLNLAGPFPFTTTARSSLPQPHTCTMFYFTCTSVRLPLSHLHSIHIPHSHNHSIHNIPVTKYE